MYKTHREEERQVFPPDCFVIENKFVTLHPKSRSQFNNNNSIMKTTLHSILLSALCLMGAGLFAACSSDDDDDATKKHQAEEETKGYNMTIEAKRSAYTIRAKSSDALSEADKMVINPKWTEGDEVTVRGVNYSGTLKVMNVRNDGRECTLKGTVDVDKITTLTRIRFYYHYVPTAWYEDVFDDPDYSRYDNQDGTPKTIASKYNIAGISDCLMDFDFVDPHSIKLDTDFENWQSIVKFTLKDEAGNLLCPTKFDVIRGSKGWTPDSWWNPDYWVRLSGIPASTYTTNGKGVLYVVLPGSVHDNVILSATVDGHPYIYTMGRSDLLTGEFYTYEVVMERAD